MSNILPSFVNQIPTELKTDWKRRLRFLALIAFFVLVVELYHGSGSKTSSNSAEPLPDDHRKTHHDAAPVYDHLFRVPSPGKEPSIKPDAVKGRPTNPETINNFATCKQHCEYMLSQCEEFICGLHGAQHVSLDEYKLSQCIVTCKNKFGTCRQQCMKEFP